MKREMSYKNYLKSIGRKPLDLRKLRTRKAPGDIEMVYDRKTRSWRPHVHTHPLMED